MSIFILFIDWAATVKVQKLNEDNLYLLPKSTDEHHKPIILTKDDSVGSKLRKLLMYFNF